MALKFPSTEWLAELKNQINASSAYAEAAKTWEGDLNFVIETSPGIAQAVVIYLDLWHGACRDATLSDESGAHDARFRISGPLENWKKIITKQMGPVPALVTGQLKVKGNMPYILRHVRAAQELVECTTHIDTEFPA